MKHLSLILFKVIYQASLDVEPWHMWRRNALYAHVFFFFIKNIFATVTRRIYQSTMHFLGGNLLNQTLIDCGVRHNHFVTHTHYFPRSVQTTLL